MGSVYVLRLTWYVHRPFQAVMRSKYQYPGDIGPESTRKHTQLQHSTHNVFRTVKFQNCIIIATHYFVLLWYIVMPMNYLVKFFTFRSDLVESEGGRERSE